MARRHRFYELSGAQPVPKGPFIALAPGADVVCHAVDIPKRVPEHARPAIAKRQLEDRLSLSGDSFHALSTAGQTWGRALAVQSAKAAEWRAALAPHGARCLGLMPDYLALPLAPGQGTLWVLPAKDAGAPPDMLVRLGEASGFRAEWEVALAALALAPGLPKALAVHGPVTEAQRADLDGLPVKMTFQDAAVPAFQNLRPDRKALIVNLLEDEATRIRQMQSAVTRWALPAALAVLAGAVWITALWSEVQSNTRQLARINEVNTQIVRRYFIPNGPLLDLRAQVAQLTARSGSQGQAAEDRAVNPVPLLQRAAAPLTASGAEVTQILYTAPAQPTQPAALSIELTLPGFADVDALLEEMRAQALSATLEQSAARPAGGVQARLQVSAP